MKKQNIYVKKKTYTYKHNKHNKPNKHLNTKVTSEDIKKLKEHFDKLCIV